MVVKILLRSVKERVESVPEEEGRAQFGGGRQLLEENGSRIQPRRCRWTGRRGLDRSACRTPIRVRAAEAGGSLSREWLCNRTNPSATVCNVSHCLPASKATGNDGKELAIGERELQLTHHPIPPLLSSLVTSLLLAVMSSL